MHLRQALTWSVRQPIRRGDNLIGFGKGGAGSFPHRLMVLLERPMIRTTSFTLRMAASAGRDHVGSRVLHQVVQKAAALRRPRTGAHRGPQIRTDLASRPFRLGGARTYGSLQRRRQSEIGISMPTRACSPRIAHEGPVPQPLWPGPWPIYPRRCRQPCCPLLGLRRPAAVGITARPPTSPSLFAATRRWVQVGVKKRRARERAR